MIGKKILGYTVDEKIGSGGFGTVYKVSKTNASGTYIRALKHIEIPSRKQYADILNSMGGDYSKANDYFAGVLKEIINEVQIISTLSENETQNIVRYYENDIVVTDSPRKYNIYILMEYLTPFTEYMYQTELKVKDAIRLGKDILAALISCHEQKIIHRDIKDDNIFVSANGSYKLGDFGVSKKLKDGSKAESVKGTPNFIAPEVYLGKEEYDDTIDVYSLGIVLYKLLNRSRNPFLPAFPQTYNSDDEDRAFERRMKGEVPELPYDAQNALGEAILPAIRNRNQRYDSAKDFLAALEQAEGELSEAELNTVINTVILPEQKTLNVPKDKSLDATIGSDYDVPVKVREDYGADSDLFETVSDAFNLDENRIKSESPDLSEENKTGKKKSVTIIPIVALLLLFTFGALAVYFLHGKDNKGSVEKVATYSKQEANTDSAGGDESDTSGADKVESGIGNESESLQKASVELEAPKGSYTEIILSSAAATSVLDPESEEIHYEPYRAIDNDIVTSWQEGAEGNGKGEKLTVYLAQKTDVKYICLWAGNWRAAEQFRNNNRPKDVMITIGDEEFDVRLSDGMKEKYIVFQEPIETSLIVFTFESVYGGVTSDDLCISEVKVYS